MRISLNRLYGLKFNVFANMLVAIVGVLAVGVAFVNHFASPAKGGATSEGGTTPALVGTRVAPIEGINYEKAAHTLLLFLDTTKDDSNDSVAIFKALTAARDARPELFQVVALFADKPDTVEEHLRKWQWSVEHRGDVKPAEYRADTVPFVMMINREGVIEKRWRGQFSSAQGVDMLNALGAWTPHDLPRPTSVRANVKLYDDQRALRTVELPALLSGTLRGLARAGDPTYREISKFGVDGEGHIYFNYQEHVVKVDSTGKLLKWVSMPKGFISGYCVDHAGNSYFYRQTKVIDIWSPDLEPTSSISLENALGNSAPFVVKMAVDDVNQQLYVQTYEPQLREQALYRIDLRSREVRILHLLRDSPVTIPSYGPGIFDWDIGDAMLYVSDPQEYRIVTYSLRDGTLLDTFSRPFEVRPINPEDARLQSLGRDLPYILKPGAMNTYPAIWKITAAEHGKLLVFTSLRDIEQRQVIHIYDRGFRFRGVALKYFRPGVNNHLVSGHYIFVADCGGDEELPPSEKVSPLDAPALATKLKIFKLELN